MCIVTCMTQVTSKAQTVGPSVVGLRHGARRGSGLVVAQDRVAVLTHSIARTPIEVVFSDGRSAEAEPAGADRRHGLTVLQVPTLDAPIIAFSEHSVEIGDVVYALANPGASGLRVTEGRVSAAALTVRGRHGRPVDGVIEHTAPLPRGSGGGPLVDDAGQVLGLNVLRSDPGFLLALPATVVAPVIERLLGGGPETAHLGLALVPPRASRRMRAAVGLAERDGLIVRDIEADGPAARAGVHTGDLLVGLGEADLKTIGDVFRALDAAVDRVALRLVRGTDELELTVDLSGAGAPQ